MKIALTYFCKTFPTQSKPISYPIRQYSEKCLSYGKLLLQDKLHKRFSKKYPIHQVNSYLVFAPLRLRKILNTRKQAKFKINLILAFVILPKFLHIPILHYAFSSWIETTVTKTIHRHWENRFVLQQYGPVRKFYPFEFVKHVSTETSVIFS